MRASCAVGQSADESARIGRQGACQIVVIMLGGATYLEAEAVNKFNAARRRSERRSNAVLGASTVLSTQQFVDRLQQLSSS